MTARRGRAPWQSGARSVASTCWQAVTRASHIRAPWSRGSVASSQVAGSVAGAGLVSGSRAALMVAASSRVPRPRSLTPPAPSSVMERNRWWCAARSGRSRSFSASRSALSGSATSARCLAALASSVAVSFADWSSRNASPCSRTPVSLGQLLDGGHDHRGLLRGDPPGRQGGVRRGPLTDQDRRLPDRPVPLAAGGARQVGEPLRGRPPGQLLLGDPPGLHLGQDRGLQRGQVGPDRLQLGDRVHDLARRPWRPTGSRPGG